ncbi:MAG: bifunctional nuclease family protein [Gemmatimonadetes bacterium]|nr:bifunctional nuclease family protein [Gemmatimonadota bacterium]
MIEVRVENIGLDSASNTPVVILREVGAERVLPIWIGPGEAQAIAMHLRGMAFQRPLTHDLLVAVMGGLGGSLQRVLITRVENSTYFAELIVEVEGRLVSIDARPSDSIALALRADARIYAENALLEPGEDGPPTPPENLRGEEEPGVSGAQLEEHLRQLRPEDLGRFNPS